MLIEFGLICLVIPALISFGLIWGIRRWTDKWDNFLPVAVVLGLVVPFWMLVGNEIFRPTRHWHWLSAVTVASGLAVSTCLNQKSNWISCWICTAALAIGSAILLVPGWKELDPLRTNLIVALAVGLFVSQIAWGYVARHRPKWAVWALFAIALVSAGWVARSFSLSNSRWLLITVGTTFGMGLSLATSTFRAGQPQVKSEGRFVWRMILPLALWFSAGLFVAMIEPNPPRYELTIAVALAVILAGVVACLQKFNVKASASE